MSIFLDSAQIEDVKRAQQLGFVCGVTTNPSHIARTGRPGLDVLRDLLDLTDGPVFYQVTAATVEERYAQAWELHSLCPDRIVVKIPATTENLALTSRLVRAGVDCLVTAVASPAQVYLAAQAGAHYVAPYVNRLTRQYGDGVAIVREMARILQGTQTEILAASLKSVDEVVAVLLAGAHHVTVPLDLILAMGEHEFSQQAIIEFNQAQIPA